MTILMVDDDASLLNMLRMLVQKHMPDAIILSAHSADEAIRLLSTAKMDIVYTDYNMPGEKNGLDVVKAFRAANPDTVIVLATGEISGNIPSAALRVGASGALRKPFTANELLSFLAPRPLAKTG